jgi:glucose-6-phosphate dehydrogenase assembly protein OpcA
VSDGRVQSFGRGEAVGVDPQAVERELAALWRASSSGEQPLVRACLWNLVVRGAGREAHARAVDMARRAGPSCPTRLLVLDVDADAATTVEERLEALASANCHLAPGGGKLLCSEEITLVGRGAARAHVPALVRGLLVPDVPTALLWLGPTDLGEIERLMGGVDRLIIDTGDLEGGADLGHAARLLPVAGDVRLADLGWLRLGPLRLLLASLFDPPVGAGPLDRLARVRLDCARHGAATAGLVLGWLATRLGWGRPERLAASRWRVPHPGGGIEITLEARDVDAGRDGIYELALETTERERFTVADAGPETLRIEATGLPARVVAAPERADAELLVAALGARGHDPLFGAALARVAELGA